jgi:hypothetical protein
MEELEGILETGGALAVEIAASAMAERGGVSANCPNCGHPLIGPYCAICGQPHNTHRRTLGNLLHEFFKDIVSFDSRILRTGRALLVQPGELPRAFREGRTQRYMPAVRLYLFVSLLFFLFLSVTGIAFVQFGMQIETVRFVHDPAGHVFEIKNGKRHQMDGLKSDAKGNISLSDPDVPGIIIPHVKANGDVNNHIATQPVFFERIGRHKLNVSPEVRAQLEKIKADEMENLKDTTGVARGVYAMLTRLETDPAALNGPLMTWIPRILFFLLPLFAVLLAAFYWRKRKEFYFVDHMMFSLTMHTFAFVALIVAAAAAQLIDGAWVTILTIIVISAYLLLSLKHFYGQKWHTTSLKFIAIAIIYPVFFLLPALGIALIASIVEG